MAGSGKRRALPEGTLPASLALMRTALPVLLAGLLALGGCKLIDQRTFERTPPAPSAAAVNAPPLPPLPTLTIQPDRLGSDWRARLDSAVRMAMAHNPHSHFDVLTPIPTSASRKIQDGFERAGAIDAQTVATALQEDRVDASQITIGYQGDAGKPTREVRLYVH